MCQSQKNQLTNMIREARNKIEEPDQRYIGRLLSSMSIKSMSIQDCGLNDVAAKSIGEALPQLTQLRELFLDKNAITGVGCGHIARGLASNRSVLLLDLGQNPVTNEGCAALKDMLEQNITLARLYLWETKIEHKGVKHIAEGLKRNRRLAKLVLTSNKVGEEGGQALGKALAVNKSLRELNLRDCSLGSQSAIALARGLAHNPRLCKLLLSNNKIGSDAGEALAEMLRTNTALEVLDLNKNAIQDEGLGPIVHSLRNNASLKKLWMKENKLSDDVVGKLLSDCVRMNQTIESLNFSDNPLTTVSIKYWIRCLAENRSLSRLLLLSEDYGRRDGDTSVSTLNKLMNIQHKRTFVYDTLLALSSPRHVKRMQDQKCGLQYLSPNLVKKFARISGLQDKFDKFPEGITEGVSSHSTSDEHEEQMGGDRMASPLTM